MTSLSLLGAGPMGSALARSLLNAGFPVTAWNRTAARLDALIQAGARGAGTPHEAILAGGVIIVCTANYAVTDLFAQNEACTTALCGKVLVQLSTGDPREARTTATWAAAHGIRYLDGAILVTPGQIGGDDSAMLIAGDPDGYSVAAPILRILARQLTYLGADAGHAAALDLAFLSHFFGGLLGFYHGARILESEGMPVTALGDMVAAVAPALGEIIRHDAGVIASGRFGSPESTLRNSAAIVELMARHAAEAHLDATFPDCAAALFRRSMKAGLGDEDVAALIKILRERS